MAQPYVTGPASIWVAPGLSAPLFLGHAERSPSIQVRPSHSPIFSDLSGQRVPLDYIYDGEEALISMDLTRFNEAVYRLIANRGTPGLGTRGLDIPGDIGTLLGTEGRAYPLWIRFPYSAKTAFSNATNGAMPGGYRFPLAFLEGPDGLDGLGTTNRRLRLNFHAIRYLDVSVTNTFGAGSLLLYDHNMGAVSSLPIN